MAIEETTPRTIDYESKLYESGKLAERALQQLDAIGYGQDRVSLIMTESQLPIDQNFASDTSPLAELGHMGEVGGALGTAGGATAGALAAAAGTALVAAAGIVITGPLAFALMGLGLTAGAVWGALIGGLLELGVEAEDWRAGLKRGGVAIVVTLRSHGDRAAVRKALMDW